MADKIYTTTYSDFRGVDYTNDASNVWKRRSPTGYNMLPDESGRPFKRTGWEIFLSNDEIRNILADTVTVYEESSPTQAEYEADPMKYYTESGGEYTRCAASDPYDGGAQYYIAVPTKVPPEELIITKMSWFELAGTDHIVVFTDNGVFFYNGEVTAINKDEGCYSGYDRCFFFEGGGTSAFYIYGESDGQCKVWKYDDSFTLTNVTNNVTVPTVLAGASADGTGTVVRGYNMFGNKAYAEYNSVALSRFGYTYAVVLPTNVKVAQYGDVTVWRSVSSQFDTKMTVKTVAPAATNECRLVEDVTVAPNDKRGVIVFYSTPPTELVAGEDFIRVEFPTVETSQSSYSSTGITGTASLVGGAV